MKRALYLALIIGAWIFLIAPIGLVLTGGNISVQSNAAHAAGATTTAAPTFQCAKDANGKCSQLLLDTSTCNGAPGVQIGLPILSGGSTCVSNAVGSGGAIIVYLRDILTLLSGAVAIIVMIMLVTAGVQYVTSVGDPSMIKSAKTRIVNALTALLLFLTMFAILQFLVPGGIL
jgi:hypothetical protein